MPVEERREMIATAAIPLFIEQGATVTTRQIADSLGIAEGTLFRAFGDKDALVRAVIEAFFAQTDDGLGPALEGPGLTTADKLRILVSHARARAKGVFAMFALMDPREAHGYMKRGRQGRFEAIVTKAFEADAAALNLPAERVGALLRLIVIAASAPRLTEGPEVTDDELVDFALYGIAGHPRHDAAADAPRGKD